MNKIILLGVMVVMLTGCADNVTFEQAATIEPVGFLHGLWHGVTVAIAFIGSLFNDGIAVYAIYNNGAFYDLGFLMGASGSLGGTVVQYVKH